MWIWVCVTVGSIQQLETLIAFAYKLDYCAVLARIVDVKYKLLFDPTGSLGKERGQKNIAAGKNFVAIKKR